MEASNAAWEPLSPERLCRLLRLAAEVADADPDHDLLTALDVLNKERLDPAGEAQMHEGELRQIARALHAEVPHDERIVGLGSDVAGVNAWLGRRARTRPRVQTTTSSALAQLLRQAAARIEDVQDGERDG